MSTFGSFLVGNKINEKITCLFFIFQAHLCLDTDMSSISTLALGLKLKCFSSFFLCTDDYGWQVCWRHLELAEECHPGNSEEKQ